MASFLENMFCGNYQAEIAALKKQVATLDINNRALRSNNNKLSARVTELNQQIKIASQYSSAEKFKDLPKMDDLITSGRAVTVGNYQTKWQEQFGKRLSTIKLHTEGAYTHWARLGLATWRIPKAVFVQLIALIPVSLWEPIQGVNGRSFMCNDFATAMLSEINMSPFWDIFVGVVFVQNHRINCVWFSDEEDIWYLEPQTNRLWKPDNTNPADTPYELII